MNIVDSVAAFLVAVLSGTGVGGGGLLIIYLTAFAHMGQLDAQRLNLIFFVCAALGAIPYHLKKRKLNASLIVLAVVMGVMGTLFGTLLRNAFEEETIRKIFGVMLSIMGITTLIKGLPERRKKDRGNGRGPK